MKSRNQKLLFEHKVYMLRQRVSLRSAQCTAPSIWQCFSMRQTAENCLKINKKNSKMKQALCFRSQWHQNKVQHKDAPCRHG